MSGLPGTVEGDGVSPGPVGRAGNASAEVGLLIGDVVLHRPVSEAHGQASSSSGWIARVEAHLSHSPFPSDTQSVGV